MTRPVIVFGDGAAEGFVKIFDLSIQNLREAQEEGSGDSTLGKGLQQGDDLDSHKRVSSGMNRQTSLLAYTEVPGSPILHAVNPVRYLARRQPKSLGQFFHL